MEDKKEIELVDESVFEGMFSEGSDDGEQLNSAANLDDSHEVDPDFIKEKVLGIGAEETDNKEDKEDDQIKDTEPTKKAGSKYEEDEHEDVEDSSVDSEFVSPFIDTLAGELGWEFEEDEYKPSTIPELIEYIKDIVEENSQPNFASQQVAEINEYVANGGNIYDYLEASMDLDLSNIDLESENDQRRVVEQNLSELGYTPDKIRRMINRYEDADVLKEEAEDAIALIEKRNEEKRTRLMEQQYQEKQEAELRQKEYFNNTINTINSVDSLFGLPLTKKDKQELVEYIFKPTSNGKTKYQQEYNGDYFNNLVASAYLIMKKDKLAKSVKESGKTDAVKAFRDKLKSSTGLKSTQKQSKDNLEALNSAFRY